MTRYKLPAALGGGEYGARYTHASVANFDIPDVGRVTLPVASLVEVPPMSEPEPGAWLIGGVLAVRWTTDDVERWSYDGQEGEGLREWAQVWTAIGGTDAPITRLVPESSDRAHCEIASWAGGEPGSWGVKCRCGIVVDHCDSIAEARAGHIDSPGEDRAQPPAVDLPWTHTDAGGDSVTIGITANHTLRVGRVPYVEVTERVDGDVSRRAAWLDTHEARMGAIAAIHAADEAIGGEE